MQTDKLRSVNASHSAPPSPPIVSENKESPQAAASAVGSGMGYAPLPSDLNGSGNGNGNGISISGGGGRGRGGGGGGGGGGDGVCGLGCRQFRAMMYKNWLVKKRNPGQFACELITPLLMMFILVIGYDFSLQRVTDVPTTYYANDTSLLQNILNVFENDVYPIPPDELEAVRSHRDRYGLSMPSAELLFGGGTPPPPVFDPSTGEAVNPNEPEIDRHYKVMYLPPLPARGKSALGDVINSMFGADRQSETAGVGARPPHNATCYRAGDLPFEFCPKQRDITTVVCDRLIDPFVGQNREFVVCRVSCVV